MERKIPKFIREYKKKENPIYSNEYELSVSASNSPEENKGILNKLKKRETEGKKIHKKTINFPFRNGEVKFNRVFDNREENQITLEKKLKNKSIFYIYIGKNEKPKYKEYVDIEFNSDKYNAQRAEKSTRTDEYVYLSYDVFGRIINEKYKKTIADSVEFEDYLLKDKYTTQYYYIDTYRYENILEKLGEMYKETFTIIPDTERSRSSSGGGKKRYIMYENKKRLIRINKNQRRFIKYNNKKIYIDKK